MKKVLYILIVFLLVFIVYGCAYETDAVRFEKEYETHNGKTFSDNLKYLEVDIGDENPIVYATADEIVELLESGTGVIYFGYPECPWCRNAVPVLLDAAEEVGVSKIYYMNMKEQRDELVVDENGNIIAKDTGTSDYKKLLTALDEVLDDYIIKDEEGNEYNTGEKRIYVPLVVFVKNGEIVGTHMDTVSSQTNPFVELTDEQEDELEQIYANLMIQSLDNVCDSSC